MKKLFCFASLIIACSVWLMPAAHAGEVNRSVIKVTASTWEKAGGGYSDKLPKLSLDGDLKTAWMAEGEGVWIQYDFGSSVPLKAVKLAFFGGDNRAYTFDILVSETGADNSWTTVGKKLESGGKTIQLETFEFPKTQARYVRIVGHGNTSDEGDRWCGITEAAFVTE